MYAKGSKATGVCDRCGIEWKLSRLRYEPKAGRTTRLRVCPDCYDPDDPKDRPHLYTAKAEAIAVRDPRPANAEDQRNASLWGWGPVLGAEIPVLPFATGFTHHDFNDRLAPRYLLTEDSERILTEDGSFLTLE